MLSRVAESVYWMFRYMERVQNISRFIDADFNSLLYDPRNKDNIWTSLIAVTGDKEEFEKRYSSYTRENIINFLTVDTTYVNSILSCLTFARENARSIREIISSEMWEEINSLYLLIKDFERSPKAKADPYEFCKAVQIGGHVFTGLFYSTMNRGEAWHFARMGMLLERADKTSRILDVKYFILLPEVSYVGTAYDNMQWGALLKSASGLEMYRKKYRRINPKDVSEFLLFDAQFPRSIRHCFLYTEQSLKAVSGSGTEIAPNPAGRSMYRLRAEIEAGTIQEVLNAGLHDYLDSLQTKMNTVDEDLQRAFFALKPESITGSSHGT